MSNRGGGGHYNGGGGGGGGYSGGGGQQQQYQYSGGQQYQGGGGGGGFQQGGGGGYNGGGGFQQGGGGGGYNGGFQQGGFQPQQGGGGGAPGFNTRSRNRRGGGQNQQQQQQQGGGPQQGGQQQQQQPQQQGGGPPRGGGRGGRGGRGFSHQSGGRESYAAVNPRDLPCPFFTSGAGCRFDANTCMHHHFCQLISQHSTPGAAKAPPITALDVFPGERSGFLFGQESSIIALTFSAGAAQANPMQNTPGPVSAVIFNEEFVFAAYEAQASGGPDPHAATAVNVGLLLVAPRGAAAARGLQPHLFPEHGYAHKQRISCLQIMVYEGKTMLVSGGDEGDIKFWHVNQSGKFELYATMPNGHVRAVTSLVLNPKEDRADGKTLVISGSADHSVKIWEVPSLTCLHTIQPTKFNVPVSISATSPAAKPGGFASIAHASVGIEVASSSRPNGDDIVALEIVQVEVPTIYQLLYIGCRSGEIRCYNITDVTTTKPILATDPKHYIAPGPVELTSMCHVESKNDQLLFTGYADGRIVGRELKVQGINFVCFNIANVDPTKQQRGHFPNTAISYLQQVEDDEKCYVVSGGADGRICVWNILDPSESQA